MPPVDAAAVARIAPQRFGGTGYRHVAMRYDPLSGEGARIHGGRYNPPVSFSTVYMCLSRAWVVAEFHRRAQVEVIGADGLLPRRLYTYDISLERVLDLVDPAVRRRVGMTSAELVEDDPSVPREIGVIAHGLGTQAIMAPSATGTDEILAIFLDNLGESVVAVSGAEEWTSIEDVRA